MSLVVAPKTNMSETAEDRAKRLIEWRKKHGKTRLIEKTPVAKSGRYKTRLRPRAVRAKKQTPCKRGRDENVCNVINVNIFLICLR